MLPNKRKLKHFEHSLMPEILCGWRGKRDMCAPLDLFFKNRLLENVLEVLNYESKLYKKYPVIYKGYRPSNTFEIHKKYLHKEHYQVKYSSFIM